MVHMEEAYPSRLQSSKGLGLINYSCTPHASSEPERLIIFEQKVKYALMPPGFAIDDGVAVLFINGKFNKVFSKKARSESGNDQIILDQVELLYYSDDLNNWKITSDKGQMYDDTNILVLSGNVLIKNKLIEGSSP